MKEWHSQYKMWHTLLPSPSFSFSLSLIHSQQIFTQPNRVAEMSNLQKGMSMLISVFHQYSGKEGDSKTLTKGELTDLLNSEMGDIFGKASDKQALDKIFKSLDADKSGTVDFQEYVTFVACITMLCNESLSK
ncbi:ictacalcin-like isoform X1 [Anguilla rostrata]|uniref:ictacalcin-like isoform X1 n=1 Tax=Anguilla rostrata TaxID=7938 RepID=UPI0030D249B3